MARKKVSFLEKIIYFSITMIIFFAFLSSLFKPDTSKIPLKLTEFSNIKQGLNSYFCTNKFLSWKTTSPADKNRDTDIKVSYIIGLNDGNQISIHDQNLDIFQFSSMSYDDKTYNKVNNESNSCYVIGVDFRQVPTLIYQKGYNRKTQTDLYKKEMLEQSDFASKVDYILYSFKDRDNKELISFTAKR